jgi:DNA-binding response OmpR family regulator
MADCHLPFFKYVSTICIMEPNTNTTPQSNPTVSHPKRILLVEDDDALANVYTTRLQAEGLDVRRVANGEDALAAAISYQPNLVLLDVMMPKVSGFDVLDILRNTPETTNLKIIMLTALSQDSDKERAETLGVDEYLVKSQVVIADVVDRIKHHLHLEGK